MEGWGIRRNEWQFGLGVQHEVLPRMSVELTYNRRKYGNLTDTDSINQGCDYYGDRSAQFPAEACVEGFKNYVDPTGLRDFYSIQVPLDSRLPDDGGYVIRGNANQSLSGALPSGAGSVTLIRPELDYTWAGFDTNVVIRARGGLRLSGGTSTGRANRDLCTTAIDTPNVKGREGNEYRGGCLQKEPFLTNVRGNASYTIPWIDVLTGVVFQYRPGPERSANLTYTSNDVIWEPGDANRAGTPFNTATGTTTTQTVNLLDSRDVYGEGLRLWDLTFRKNIRFGGKLLSVGVDVYNLFNSDAALTYQNTYTAFRLADGTWVSDNPVTPSVEFNDWNRVTGITNPRFARFSLTFDF